MAKRKKRAWNMSNPLFRYLNAKKGAKKKRKFSRVVKMVRRRSRKVSSRASGFGGSKLMNGLIQPKGLIAQALIGAGAATLAENTGLSNAIPYGKYAAGFAVAGAGGIAGVFVRDMIKGQAGTSSSAGYV